MAAYESSLVREALRNRVGYFTAGNSKSKGIIGPPVPPSSINPPFSEVVALLHMEGLNAGTVFTNSTTRGATPFNQTNATTSTADFKFGTSSMASTTANWSIWSTHADYNFGTDPWVIEFWVKPTSLALDWNSVKEYYDSRDNSLTAVAAPQIYSDTADGQLKVNVNGTIIITGSAGDMTAGIWQHVALCKSGGNTRLFVQGAQKGTTYVDSLTYASPGRVTLAAAGNAAGAANGFYDELRLAHGPNSGIYSAPFSPPSSAFPDS